jgi:hypothetical protein
VAQGDNRGAAKKTASSSTASKPDDEKQQQAREENENRSPVEAGMVPPVPVSGQYGTNEDVLAEGEEIKDKAEKSTGSYAIDADASPLTPVDQHTQVVPRAGSPTSSTNAVSASAAQRPQAGDRHLGLIDEDGNDLSADDIFDAPNGPATFVEAKTRVYERFTYPGGQTVMTRLLYNKGARVDLLTAERVKAAVAAAAR